MGKRPGDMSIQAPSIAAKKDRPEIAALPVSVFSCFRLLCVRLSPHVCGRAQTMDHGLRVFRHLEFVWV